MNLSPPTRNGVKRRAQEASPGDHRNGTVGHRVVAGCGGTALVTPNMIIPTTTTTTTAGESNATSDTDDSASYCQRLNDGKWVTNDSAFSTTPCVPDPADATGDEQADGCASLAPLLHLHSVGLGARRRAGRNTEWVRHGNQAADSSSSSGLPAAAAGSFLKACAQNADGGLCACVSSQVAQQVPRYQLRALTADDPRVQAALESCAP